jgi:hypothetical protein
MKEDVKHFVHTCVKCQNMVHLFIKKNDYISLYDPKWAME